MFMKNSWKKALAAFAGASILMSVSLSYVEAAAMTNSNQRVAKKIVQTAGRERLGDFAPDFARYNDDILFGEVWSKNDVLSLHDRSIVTVSGLVGSGVIDSSLKYHIQSAKNNGEVYAEPAAAAAAVTDKEKFQQEIMFPIGEPNTAYAKYFIGQSYLAPVSTQQVAMYNVTFEPGCRNNWHIHHAKSGGGQMLICVGGQGWYQEYGKPAVKLLPGTVVNIPANVKHWHGAAADSWMSHLAIEVAGEETSNEWCEPVTDAEYGKLK